MDLTTRTTLGGVHCYSAKNKIRLRIYDTYCLVAFVAYAYTNW